ncbi:MAG: short-chain dehydrogenase [Clostridiales bacterium GWF2_36_10]|nr:MAG: short-chain dehydrogenase [Clostridiales bacterium GWF2_36_10]HAN21773.1 short-chain dehydrogenase [Clostridiales bacterium]
MKIDLSNKTALITGATGQLGRVMVRTLAECGANIIIHYHNNIEKAKELYSEIEKIGRRAFIVQADITDFNSIIQMKEKITSEFTLPDIIVDNAVIQYRWTTVLEQAAEDYESQFKSCVMQNVYMAKAFVQPMIEKNTGRFIGINTECSMMNFPTQSAYVAAKRGMDGVMRILAKEIGEYNITVNQVAPGWTISDNDRQWGTEYSKEYCEKVPLKRRGTDQEIANVVAFLASDLASFITGAYIPVCGGNVMPTI